MSPLPILHFSLPLFLLISSLPIPSFPSPSFSPFPFPPPFFSTIRLDRLASGVLVIARSTEKAALFHKHLKQNFIEKEYLARVKVFQSTIACSHTIIIIIMKGVFPEGPVEVKEPIAKLQDDPPLYGAGVGGEQKYRVP